MSRIALTPNNGGTGTFTIAAPGTNTDRTLTLPDATGTINTSGLANEVPAGSAGAPAIYPTGDTNTGVFFPAADTIAFSEGGTEAMRIASSGYVGIGTTAPTAPLTVSAVGNSLNLVNPATGLRFYVSTLNFATFLGNSTNNPLVFYTNNVERMQITENGFLRFDSGYGSAATAYGCRAWVNFNGTNGAIRASGGVSSVTYNGTGQSTVNFTTAMPDVNYSAVCSGHSAGFTRQSIAMPSSSGYATGSVVILYGNTINGAAENLTHVNVSVFR